MDALEREAERLWLRLSLVNGKKFAIDEFEVRLLPRSTMTGFAVADVEIKTTHRRLGEIKFSAVLSGWMKILSDEIGTVFCIEIEAAIAEWMSEPLS